MVEEIFSIDRMEHAVSLFGSFDENIKLIEKAFDVSFITRGSEIKIKGDEENVDKAKRTITSLLLLINKGEAITDQNLEYIFNLVNDGEENYYFSEDGVTKNYDFTVGFYNFFQYFSITEFVFYCISFNIFVTFNK